MSEIYGQDIALDDAGQAKVAANGELVLTSGAETGVQDVRLRLFTPLGELFYDENFGALLYDWINEENTTANRQGFEAEVERRIQADPRVVVGSAWCKVQSWDERVLLARAGWTFIDADHQYNLVIELDGNKQDMVIKDVNPRFGL